MRLTWGICSSMTCSIQSTALPAGGPFKRGFGWRSLGFTGASAGSGQVSTPQAAVLAVICSSRNDRGWGDMDIPLKPKSGLSGPLRRIQQK